MRAVRLRNRRHHWVLEPGRHQTLCGADLIRLPVEAELEIDHLPAGEICVQCEALRQSGAYAGANRTVLPPSYGTLRRTGPLNHGIGTAGRRNYGGQKLPPHS
jgi:hypothetical protein